MKSIDGGAIHLEDGRTLPANYHEFTHGYAVTAHRSQGKTVETVIISADTMKRIVLRGCGRDFNKAVFRL